MSRRLTIPGRFAHGCLRVAVLLPVGRRAHEELLRLCLFLPLILACNWVNEWPAFWDLLRGLRRRLLSNRYLDALELLFDLGELRCDLRVRIVGADPEGSYLRTSIIGNDL